MRLSEIMFLNHPPLQFRSIWPKPDEMPITVVAHFIGEGAEEKADAFRKSHPRESQSWWTAICRFDNGAYWLVNPGYDNKSLREAIEADCNYSIDDGNSGISLAIRVLEALKAEEY